MKIVKILICLFLFGVVLFLCLHFFKKETLSEEKLCQSDNSSICWGYAVDSYPTRNFVTFRIWHSWRLNQSYSFPNYFGTPKVAEQRWLAGGTAFYLYLDNVNTDNSYLQKQKMRVIYDFESGQMYAEQYSAHWLNSTLNSRNGKTLNLLESEFDQVLADFENEQ